MMIGIGRCASRDGRREHCVGRCVLGRVEVGAGRILTGQQLNECHCVEGDDDVRGWSLLVVRTFVLVVCTVATVRYLGGFGW